MAKQPEKKRLMVLSLLKCCQKTTVQRVEALLHKVIELRHQHCYIWGTTIEYILVPPALHDASHMDTEESRFEKERFKNECGCESILD